MASLGLVGRGRAARSLEPLLRRAPGLDVAWWWSRGEAPALATLPEVDIVLLAVPDGAIESAAAALAARSAASGEIWLHLSGSRPGRLARHDATRPRAAGCLHPLQALPGRAVPPSHLHGVTAGIDGDPEACAAAEAIAEALGMVPRHLAQGTKALYHAAAVTVAGHATALFAQAVAMLAACGFDEEDARATLRPLMRGAVDNLESTPSHEAVTGPITRGDPETVRAHLDALDALDPHLAATYRHLAASALALSLRSGGGSSSDAEEALRGAISPPGRDP